jgi:Na+/glutamate symporter
MINMFLGALFGGLISAAAFGSATTRPVRRLAVRLGLGCALFGLIGTVLYIAITYP